QGGGLAALGDPQGDVTIKAVKNIDIGAGISGAGITLSGQNVISTGTGAINGATVNISATGTVSGNISAVGAVSITGGVTVPSCRSVSPSTGLVTGAGYVASNAGSSKTSADTNLASQQMAQNGSLGGYGVSDSEGAGGPRQGVRIDVSSQPCKNQVT